jgi:hypothetical protein
MKAIIKVCTAAKEFTEDQKQILRRIANVLTEHNLSVAIILKVKKYKQLKLKAVTGISSTVDRISSINTNAKQK